MIPRELARAEARGAFGRLAPVALAVLGLLAAFAGLFALNLDSYRRLVFNADTLFPAALYADFVRGQDISRWAWSAATYWFPDVWLYGLLRFASGDLQWAAALNAVVQTLLFALGVRWIARQIISSYQPAHDALLIALTAVYVGASPLWAEGSLALFGIVLHGGVALALAFTLALALHGIFVPCSLRRRLADAAALAALSVLTTASDLFYVVQVVVPLGMAFVPFLFWMPPARRRILAFVTVVGAGSVVGFFADRLTRSYADNVTLGLAPERAGQSLAALVAAAQLATRESPLHAVLYVAFLALAAIVIARGVARRRREPTAAQAALVAFSIFVLMHLVTTVVFVVGTGIFADVTTFRYFVPTLVLSTGWGFLLVLTPLHDGSLRARRATAGAAAGISLVLLAQLALNAARLDRLVQVAAYYPPSIACLDERLPALGVTKGIATYWQARPTALLSRAGLQLAQVAADLAPFYWENGLYVYDAEPQFVLIDLQPGMPADFVIDEKRVRARFGSPAAVVDCPDARALVYGRPGDTALRDMFKGAPGMAVFRRAGDSYTYRPANLPGAVGRVVGLSRTVSGGPVGFLTFGPYVRLAAGAYAFVIDYAAQTERENVGSWDVSIAHPTGNVIAAQGTLAGGETNAHGAFTLTESGIVEVRVTYGGAGTLTVDALQLVKVK